MGNKAIRMKNQAGDNLYPCPYFPVGSVYITTVNTNPSQWFGGTWEAFAQGKTLVGVNPNETEFNTVLKTGGSKTHTLTVNEMPKHTHPVRGEGRNSDVTLGDSTWGWSNGVVPNSANNAGSHLFATEVGGSQAHNNLQPYITVYFWRRIA